MTDAYGYYPGGDQPMSLKLPSGRTGVFITDPQLRGTVRAIADADKNATNPEFKTYAVSPWGEVAADTGSITRLRMAGQQYDQGSELYYMRARYYDPELGRFLSEDPIGISGGLNLYAYAGNDPVNESDPSGLCLKPGDYLTGNDTLCVTSSAAPPTDIVTIEPGVRWPTGSYGGLAYPTKGGQAPWQVASAGPCDKFVARAALIACLLSGGTSLYNTFRPRLPNEIIYSDQQLPRSLQQPGSHPSVDVEMGSGSPGSGKTSLTPEGPAGAPSSGFWAGLWATGRAFFRSAMTVDVAPLILLPGQQQLIQAQNRARSGYYSGT